MPAIVRRISGDDWEQWRAIRLRALAEAPEAFGSRLEDVDDRELAWRSRIDTALACFVATIDGDVVGLVAADPSDGGGVTLQSMFVAAERRHFGIGRGLIAAVAEVAAGRTLALGVRADNIDAIGAYQRAGFIRDDDVAGIACDLTMRYVPTPEEPDHAR